MSFSFANSSRTLGGLSTSPLAASSSLCASTPMDTSASQPLSPTSTNQPSLFPETWLPMPVSQDFLRVPVSREDRSYRTVYSLFHKTVSETKFRIIKIQRVQNPFLWEKYKRWERDNVEDFYFFFGWCGLISFAWSVVYVLFDFDALQKVFMNIDSFKWAVARMSFLCL